MDLSSIGWQGGSEVPPARIPPQRTYIGGASFDMVAFINRVADQFQEANRALVDRSAREALIAPALPHTQSVAQALDSRALTIEFLEECVMSILERAQRIAREQGPPHISGRYIQESMDEDCPYLFWC